MAGFQVGKCALQHGLAVFQGVPLASQILDGVTRGDFPSLSIAIGIGVTALLVPTCLLVIASLSRIFWSLETQNKLVEQVRERFTKTDLRSMF